MSIIPDPLAVIEPDELATYIFWLSTRVRRRVFPNTFDTRLGNESHKLIRKALAPVDEHVDDLLYSLSSQRELEDGIAYTLRVVLLVRSTSLVNRDTREALETSKDIISEILSNKKGIVLDAIEIASDKGMSVATYHTYDRWGFEDLTLENSKYAQMTSVFPMTDV